MNPIQCMNSAEQHMTEIIEKYKPALDKFIMEDNDEHNAAKSFISFALARHFASKSAVSEE